jgi:VWFA-related protein
MCDVPRPLLLAVVASLTIGAVSAQQPATFRAEARLVVLQVTVTGTGGELVPGLGRDAFRIFENGRPQPIAIFRNDDVPVSLGLVIDNSGSMRDLRGRVEAAALAFVRASNPLDEVFIVNFANYARVDVPITRDVRTLEAGIGRQDPSGGSAVRDAISVANGYLRARAAHERRALLVLSDGKDTASSISGRDLGRLVERGGAALYAVSLGHLEGAERPARDGELGRLAQRTGGVIRRPDSVAGVSQAILEIAHQIRSAYTIGYTPAHQAYDGTFRSVRVEVTEPRGVTARTRPGYWAVAMD